MNIFEVLKMKPFTPRQKIEGLRLDENDDCIYFTLNKQKYKYIPNVTDKSGEIYSKFSDLSVESAEKAISYLMKNATGEKIND